MRYPAYYPLSIIHCPLFRPFGLKLPRHGFGGLGVKGDELPGIGLGTFHISHLPKQFTPFLIQGGKRIRILRHLLLLLRDLLREQG